MSGTQNGTPQFDFSELSWGDDKAFARMQLMLRKALEENDAELMQQAHDGLDSYLSKVTTYVPRDYLVKSAPEQIDWADPASMNYIRGSKMGEFREEVLKAKTGN